jgi:hypothetical protein
MAAIWRAERERILDGEAVKLTLDCPADVWLLPAVKRAVECHCLCQ